MNKVAFLYNYSGSGLQGEMFRQNTLVVLEKMIFADFNEIVNIMRCMIDLDFYGIISPVSQQRNKPQTFSPARNILVELPGNLNNAWELLGLLLRHSATGNKSAVCLQNTFWPVVS